MPHKLFLPVKKKKKVCPPQGRGEHHRAWQQVYDSSGFPPGDIQWRWCLPLWRSLVPLLTQSKTTITQHTNYALHPKRYTSLSLSRPLDLAAATPKSFQNNKIPHDATFFYLSTWYIFPPIAKRCLFFLYYFSHMTIVFRKSIAYIY